ncbi:RING finger protein 214 isoform X2 [Mixophyes fleayi]|uniref:RING finger protein 214 isoform X2 n=1 Tax=Mixophyes fleayi TaxID=3061075 RepID=UPI003F4E3824
MVTVQSGRQTSLLEPMGSVPSMTATLSPIAGGTVGHTVEKTGDMQSSESKLTDMDLVSEKQDLSHAVNMSELPSPIEGDVVKELDMEEDHCRPCTDSFEGDSPDSYAERPTRCIAVQGTVGYTVEKAGDMQSSESKLADMDLVFEKQDLSHAVNMSELSSPIEGDVVNELDMEEDHCRPCTDSFEGDSPDAYAERPTRCIAVQGTVGHTVEKAGDMQSLESKLADMDLVSEKQDLSHAVNMSELSSPIEGDVVNELDMEEDHCRPCTDSFEGDSPDAYAERPTRCIAVQGTVGYTVEKAGDMQSSESKLADMDLVFEKQDLSHAVNMSELSSPIEGDVVNELDMEEDHCRPCTDSFEGDSPDAYAERPTRCIAVQGTVGHTVEKAGDMQSLESKLADMDLVSEKQDLSHAVNMSELSSPIEGDVVNELDMEEDHCRPCTDSFEGDSPDAYAERPTRCIAVQTDCGKQDAETITDGDTEQILQLVERRGQLKDSYQKVLDRQTQAEKQLQVQIKLLKQQKEEEMQKQKGNLKSIQDMITKKEETKNRMEKERKEQSNKEQDLSTELVKLQNKSESLQQEHKELENKIAGLLVEQTTEREELNAELASLKKKDSELTQSALEELERAKTAEVLSLESRRDLLFISLEEAEKEAEVTLSYLRVAPANFEWIQLKQRWEARLAGILQLKANLRDQIDTQIKQVKNGTKLSNLPSILAPNLTPPPSDPNLMLQKIALAPLTVSQSTPLAASLPLKDFAPQQSLGTTSFPLQSSASLAFTPGFFPGTVPSAPRLLGASQHQGNNDVPCPPTTDKLSKILEKLQARFPHCNQVHLTDILLQVKMKRGTLSGLTVEELCQLVATQIQERLLQEASNPAAKVKQPIGHGRPLFQTTQRPSTLRPSTHVAYSSKPQLCLRCQQIVQPLDLQPMSCNHVMHRECIKFWAIVNPNNSCPFCPSQ